MTSKQICLVNRIISGKVWPDQQHIEICNGSRGSAYCFLYALFRVLEKPAAPDSAGAKSYLILKDSQSVHLTSLGSFS